MKKKKYIRNMLVIILSIVMCVSIISACSSKEKEDKYFDEEFIEAMEEGLEARWAITNRPG